MEKPKRKRTEAPGQSQQPAPAVSYVGEAILEFPGALVPLLTPDEAEEPNVNAHNHGN